MRFYGSRAQHVLTKYTYGEQSGNKGMKVAIRDLSPSEAMLADSNLTLWEVC